MLKRKVGVWSLEEVIAVFVLKWSSAKLSSKTGLPSADLLPSVTAFCKIHISGHLRQGEASSSFVHS